MEDFRVSALVPRAREVGPRLEYTSPIERDGACGLGNQGEDGQNMEWRMDTVSTRGYYEICVIDV